MRRIKIQKPDIGKMCRVQRNGKPIHKATMEIINGNFFWTSIKGGNANVTQIDDNDRWDYVC